MRKLDFAPETLEGQASGATLCSATDTPETDALLLVINEGRVYNTDGPVDNLARRLERERDEARDLLSEENHYKERIERLEQTLKTLIAWSMRDHGEHGVKQLLEMLDIEPNGKGDSQSPGQ